MGEQDFQVSQKSGEAVDVCSITKRLTNSKYKAGETVLFLQLFSPLTHYNNLRWKSVSKPSMKLLSLSFSPSCLFCLYAAVPAGEVGESPKRVQACSKLSEKCWDVRCFYCNTNHGNHFTSLSARWDVENATLATGETQTCGL